MRELYCMRHYPFAYAPFLIAATLLLNSFFPLVKSRPPAPPPVLAFVLR